MSDFKGRHFEGEIVLWAVRWYCRYGVSYRDLEQMLGERGVVVDHSTIYRWVQKYAPEMEKRLRWQWRVPRSTSWRVDGHRQLVELRLRWGAIGTACSWLRRSGDAGDLGPSLEGLAPGGSILGGRHLMAAKVEEVADPVVGGQEALRLAG